MAATWEALGQRSVRSVQALTEPGPAPTDASEGVGLIIDSVAGVAFYLDAGDGYTLTGDGGQVDVYIHDAGLWAAAPDLTMLVPTGSSGKRRVLLGVRQLVVQRGRVAMYANGVQSGNTVVALDALATSPGGRK